MFFTNAAQDAMDQVNYLAPKLLKLRLWPDLTEPGKQWASSVVDNGFVAWIGETCETVLGGSSHLVSEL